MIRVLELDLSLDLISETPLRSYRSTCCRETPKCMCYPILGQRKLKVNNVDRQLASRKAQSSCGFDLDSDRVAVLVPRQTEVSISVWGKPLELGNSPLSTNQRPFIYTGPQALSWRPSTIRSRVGPGSRLSHPNASCTLPKKAIDAPPLFLMVVCVCACVFERENYRALVCVNLGEYRRVCACVRVCEYACTCVFVCVCVCSNVCAFLPACVYVRVDVKVRILRVFVQRACLFSTNLCMSLRQPVKP